MDLTAVPGVPETTLGAEAAAALPETAPPAPWRLELGAVLWLAWPGRGAAHHLSPTLRAGVRAPLAGGGLVRYAETPVGPYAEALAAVAVVRDKRVALHVPFMAVDSARSVVGGRRNWSLPKVLARFEGEHTEGREMSARGEGWELRASARRLGPRVPFQVRLSLVQPWPDGSVRTARARLAGRARLARVSVEARGGSELRRWVGAGSRPGVVVEEVRAELGAAE
jgi:hypothetical protein